MKKKPRAGAKRQFHDLGSGGVQLGATSRPGTPRAALPACPILELTGPPRGPPLGGPRRRNLTDPNSGLHGEHPGDRLGGGPAPLAWGVPAVGSFLGGPPPSWSRPSPPIAPWRGPGPAAIGPARGAAPDRHTAGGPALKVPASGRAMSVANPQRDRFEGESDRRSQLVYPWHGGWVRPVWGHVEARRAPGGPGLPDPRAHGAAAGAAPEAVSAVAA
jgi:hypothetical protein